jgi:hypothetical protein
MEHLRRALGSRPPVSATKKKRAERRRSIQSNSSQDGFVAFDLSCEENHMAPQAIFGPFFAMMLLTLVVWAYMYVCRIHFISSAKLSPQDLAVPGELARLSPPDVTNPADNLKNLFELPVLFYALTLYLFATGQTDTGYVIAGWIFAAFRALHSAVHCTINIVMLRFWLYAIASAALWFMLLRAALAYFGMV